MIALRSGRAFSTLTKGISHEQRQDQVPRHRDDRLQPVPSNRDSLTAGARGPLLAQDVWLNEKLANFVREVILSGACTPRVPGAFGTFTVTRHHEYTAPPSSARWANRPRCSPASPPWPASAVRPTPSATSAAFALKFYTEEGNWDMVGNNTPCSSSAIRASSPT